MNNYNHDEDDDDNNGGGGGSGDDGKFNPNTVIVRLDTSGIFTVLY